MEIKELIKEFLNSFKKTLNISSFYSKDHPLFLKAVEEFKKTVDQTLNFINPIQIGVATDYLLLEQVKFSDPSSQELAKRLHLHRIQGIQIKMGVTLDELTYFLNMISMPLKDAIKDNIITHIKGKLTHLSIEEIDYFDLLKAETGEYKDIWSYLLSEAVENRNVVKASKLADNFAGMIKHFKVSSLIENNELRENIQKFLNYLKDNNKEKFPQCSKELAKYLFNVKDNISQPELEKIKKLFSGFTENDFAEILSDGILNVDGFDALSLGLFSRIIDAEKHPSVASLTTKFLGEKPVEDKQKVRDKIERLVSTSDKQSVSEVYRNTLSMFLKDVSYGKIYSVDRSLAHDNFRLILLDLLTKEKKKDRLGTTIEQISRELKIVVQRADLKYLILLTDILKQKKAEDSQVGPLFASIDKQITVFVEDNVFNEQLPEDFRYLCDYLPSSAGGIDLYLKKMFNENKVNDVALGLFLKFFPDRLQSFFDSLQKKHADIEFMEVLIRNLKILNHALALNMLEQMYALFNDYIKIEVLRAMREMGEFDKEFLISILSVGDVFLKKEALLILKRDEEARRQALEKLFLIEGPWWVKNRILLDNITAVGEVGLRDAEEYLIAISKKHFFWNWNIIRRAKEVLAKWKL